MGSEEASDDLPARLVRALGAGDPAEVATLVAAGADLHARDVFGFGAALHAVYSRDLVGDQNLLDLLRFLGARGVDMNRPSRNGETPIARLASTGRFDAVRLLLDGGADAGPLEWTPLHRAVALGSPAEVRAALAADADPELRDRAGLTPLLLAVLRGRADVVEALVAAGADPTATDSGGDGAVALAVLGGHPAMIRRLLALGVAADAVNRCGQPPIEVAAVGGRAACVKVLLDAAVDVTDERDVLADVEDGPTIRLLLDAGADPAGLSHAGRRALLGWGPPDVRLLDGIDERSFLKGCKRVFGHTNPEMLEIPFQRAMLRSGVGAWTARRHFGDRGGVPIWTADRFGQSLTILADGRMILVGGEHEDWYDPDFCIYNDVVVVGPGDAITMLGYPEKIFPPTDFHTATAVGDHLWIIGSLSYHGTRSPGTTPVHRLHLGTYRMERVQVPGPAPGWIFKHRARLVGPAAIRIGGGHVMTAGADGKDRSHPNTATWILDVSAPRWLRE